MRYLKPGLFLAIFVTLAGCAVTGQPPLVVKCKQPSNGDRSGAPALVGKEYGEQATPIPLNSIQFSDWTLAKRVSLQQLFAARTPADTIAVTARFVSCESGPFSIKVRTSFVDSKQAPTEQPSAWKTVFLNPHLTAIYEERSTSRSASYYLVEIMPN